MCRIQRFPSCLDNRRCQVGAVCRYWRQCLLENHALWRVIDIQKYTHDSNKAPQILDSITCCVQRSGACLLDIWMTLDSSYGTESGTEGFHSIIDAIIGQDGGGNVLGRWRRFVFDGRQFPDAPTPWLEYLSLRLASPAPELQELEFQRCNIKLPGTSQHPKLTTLRLSRCDITLETTLQSLRSLYLDSYETLDSTLYTSSKEFSFWLRFLNSTPLLTHLHLLHYHPSPPSLSKHINLANLTYLDIGAYPLDFLLHIRCPKLEHLTCNASHHPLPILVLLQFLYNAPRYGRILIVGFKGRGIELSCSALSEILEDMVSSSVLQEVWFESTMSAEWYAEYFGRSKIMRGRLSVRSYEDPNQVFACTSSASLDSLVIFPIDL